MAGLLKNLTLFGVVLTILLSFQIMASSQEKSTIDEFAPFEQNEKETAEALSNKPSAPDEFTEYSEESTSTCSKSCSGCSEKKDNSQLWWILSALAATIVAGFLVKFRGTRNLRGFFLLVSLVAFGFYAGGCPCPIMSFQHVLFSIIGIKTEWVKMLWFLGLIPVTYIFGKVWCGWICHLGALQEFLFIPGKIKILQTERAQKIMRIIRMVLLVALIIQILITRTNLFKTIDPFKVAFNLQASNTIGWVLLVLLLLSSVVIFRPFCKTVCPIGLILGWISKIPGASILSPQKECVGCKVCDNSCKINAITNDGKISKLDNQECIACGNCASDCKKGSMLFVRNSRKYPSKAVCQKG
jgi:polyferredoxin